VANTNKTALGLTAGDITTLTTVQGTYGTAYSAMVTARAAAKGATSTKNTAHSALIADLRSLARRIYAIPGIDPALIADLGLPVHSGTRTPVVPSAPSSLVALAQANGDVQLKWNRSGNPRGVVFWLEEKTETGDWTLFGTTLKRTHVQSGQTPGETKYYRVRASSANGAVSAPSNVAVVYASGGASVPLYIAA
jgi:hypothetical protein